MKSWVFRCFAIPCLLLVLWVGAWIKVAVFYWSEEEKLSLKQGDDVLSDSEEGLLVFLQVTDIHLSRFDTTKRKQLEDFITEVVSVVGPSFVIASGDITQGLDWWLYDDDDKHAVQQVEEWEDYADILSSFGMNSSFWFDLRGDHDSFGVLDANDENDNLYEAYGSSSQEQRMSLGMTNTSRNHYSFDRAAGGHVYRFIGIDNTYDPGLVPALNFFGIMTDELEESVISYVEQVPKNVTKVLFSHFPQVFTIGGFPDEILDAVSYHLCGHARAEGMYQRIGGSMIELELEDLDENLAWRLAAFDNGQLSFADYDLEDSFPAVLITNPKDARFLNKLEPNNANSSTHIRILAFTSSDASVSSVMVTMGNSVASASAAGSNLFVVPWTAVGGLPEESGLHTITVSVTDTNGRERVVVQEFSLDGTVPSIGDEGWQRLQIVGNPMRVAYAAVILSIILVVMLFVVEFKSLYLRSEVFFFYAFSLLALLILPIGVGEVVRDDGPIGAALVYGVAADGTYQRTFSSAIAFACFLTFYFFPHICFSVMHFSKTTDRATRTWRAFVENVLLSGCSFYLVLAIYLFMAAIYVFVGIGAVFASGWAIFISPVCWFVLACLVLQIMLLSEHVITMDIESSVNHDYTAGPPPKASVQPITLANGSTV